MSILKKQPTEEHEVTMSQSLTTKCPNCADHDKDGDRLYYYIRNGMAHGACFNCECTYCWEFK